MALNNLKCNHLTPLGLKGFKCDVVTMAIIHVSCFLSAVDVCAVLCTGPYPCKAITRMDWKTSSM